MDMDMCIDTHVKSVTMDAKFHIHGKPAFYATRKRKQLSTAWAKKYQCIIARKSDYSECVYKKYLQTQR